VSKYKDWCDTKNSQISNHSVVIFEGRPSQVGQAHAWLAETIPSHYASEEHIAKILKRLGKVESSKYLLQKLPTTKAMRSGDLGEILATEFISQETGYAVPIKRLRWKDHRNMAMRGDDVIGIWQDPTTHRLRFLKGESKSRVTMQASIIAAARVGLDKDHGLPSAHALSFISERLTELGNTSLVDAIDDAQLKYGIVPQSVQHLLFVFSGNPSEDKLKDALKLYKGAIPQLCVGLIVSGHGEFISAVFDLVASNAVNS
jgi:hypothetical protein